MKFRIVDEFGCSFMVGVCNEGHELDTCSCASPIPPRWLNADRWTLVRPVILR